MVTSLVDDVIMQLVAAIFGKPDFFNLTFSIGDGEILYCAFLTALVTFLIIAFVLFFIVKAVQKAMPAKVTGVRMSALPVLNLDRRLHMRLLH